MMVGCGILGSEKWGYARIDDGLSTDCAGAAGARGRNIRACGDCHTPAGPEAGAIHLGRSLPALTPPGERAHASRPAPRRSRGHAPVESNRTHGVLFRRP